MHSFYHVGVRWSLTLLFVLGLLILGLFSTDLSLLAQEVNVVSYGQTVDGEIVSSAGEEWRFRGCQGDTVSIIMQSEEFAGFVELYPPTGRRSLAEAQAQAGEEESGAIIEGVKLPVSGDYTILTSGERGSDRGPYTLSLAAGSEDEAALTNVDGIVSYGAALESRIVNRFGEEWGFYGCQGDIVSLEMTSADFSPYLELYGVNDRAPLAESGDDGAQSALIVRFSLPQSGPYLIITGGEEREDRGTYQITLDLVDSASDSTPTAIRTPTTTRTPRPTSTKPPRSTPTLSGTSTSTSTPRPTHTPLATSTPTPQPVAQCAVLINGLNLRGGPGTNYDPPIGAIPVNNIVLMLERNQDSTWIRVQVVSTGQIGWVSSGANYVRCTDLPANLPIGAIPPTNTPLPTPTFTPTSVVVVQPTPTLASVVIGVPSGPKGNLKGEMYTDPNLVVRFGNNGPVFRDRMVLYVEPYDPKHKDSPRNGAGIEKVQITFFRDGDEVHTQEENNAPYCAFGDAGGRCNLQDLRPGNQWPSTGKSIDGGVHTAQFRVEAKNGDIGTWEFDFEIERNDGGGQPSGTIVLELAQTGPGTNNNVVSGAFVFQVRAFNTGFGNSDGAGIDRVDMRIIDPDGTVVHERTERNAGYCIFSGGEPDCEIWRFGERGNRWPNDTEVKPGSYRLQATATDNNGQQVSNEWQVTIQ